MVAVMALETELATYNRLLHADLAGEEGHFALIAGDELLGVFESYSDALNAGYKARQLEPFLIKKISAVEMIANYTRDITPQCIALGA
jgi:hypothetical protein